MKNHSARANLGIELRLVFGQGQHTPRPQVVRVIEKAEELQKIMQNDPSVERRVWTLHAQGSSNWLAYGLHLHDVMGWVIMPSTIELPDDVAEKG